MIGDAVRAAIDAAGWRERPAADPTSVAEWQSLLAPLHAAGRRDLPVARLLEGHVDAVQIVQRHGTEAQVDRLRAAVADGAILGVWNAALPGEPLRMDGDLLYGGKAFASGAGVVTHALVTADTPGGAQLLLLDLVRTPPAIDRDWWRVIGMQRSETHLVRWHGAATSPDAAIGAPGVYATEPFFSGGALRFVAVHAGGVAALLDRTRDHLVRTGRADDPYQMARLTELHVLAEGAAAAVRHAADRWFDDPQGRLARVAAARIAVTDAADRAATVAQAAVGLQGMFVDHPLSSVLTDLAVYCRQPAPDAQRLRVGRAVADGTLTVAL